MVKACRWGQPAEKLRDPSSRGGEKQPETGPGLMQLIAELWSQFGPRGGGGSDLGKRTSHRYSFFLKHKKSPRWCGSVD